MQIKVVDHPLIKSKLTEIRDVKTPTSWFKRILDEITMLMVFEVTKDLPVENIRVQTPLTETNGYKLSGSITLVPILRAGLGFLAGGDANGEFLDTLKEYPAYFKEAGRPV